MKRLLQAFRSASRLELFVITAMVCVLLVLYLNGEGGTESSGSETRMEKILSQVEGAGKVSVLVAEDGGEIRGAVVTAEGADDMRVYLELLRAVRTLTGLESSSIEIIKSGN